MTTILELRTKRAKTWEAAKAFLETHRTEKGTLIAEDDATYSRMEQDISDLGKEIQRLERQEAWEAELQLPTSQPLTERPAFELANLKQGRATEAYQTAFWTQTRAKDGVSLPEIRNALQIGVDSEGGYLCPEEFEQALIQALKDDNIIREHAHVFTTSSGSHKIPVVTSKGTASWVDEEGAIPESDEVFGQQLLGAHKVATLIKVSEELLNDAAFDLESYFSGEFARRIGDKEEEAFLSGNGSGKPTGILDNSSGAAVGVTAAATAAITADELINLYYSLGAAYRKNAVWVLSDSTIAAIRKLKDGSGQYLWQPALHEGQFDTLLGKRLFTSPYMPLLAAGNKTVLFGDLSFYWIGDRQGITFRRLNERYAETGQVGFLTSKRVDGKLILAEAIKVLQQRA